MEDSKVIKEKDSFEGYKFVSEEAHRHHAFMFDRITDSADELHDLIYYLKHDWFSKRLFEMDDFKPFIEKMDGLIQQIDTLYEDASDVFKHKELLVKDEESAVALVEVDGNANDDEGDDCNYVN